MISNRYSRIPNYNSPLGYLTDCAYMSRAKPIFSESTENPERNTSRQNEASG